MSPLWLSATGGAAVPHLPQGTAALSQPLLTGTERAAQTPQRKQSACEAAQSRDLQQAGMEAHVLRPCSRTREHTTRSESFSARSPQPLEELHMLGCGWNRSQGQGAREPRLCHARIQFQMDSALSPASSALTAAQPLLQSPEGKHPSNAQNTFPRYGWAGTGCCQPCVHSSGQGTTARDTAAL